MADSTLWTTQEKSERQPKLSESILQRKRGSQLFLAQLITVHDSMRKIARKERVQKPRKVAEIGCHISGPQAFFNR